MVVAGRNSTSTSVSSTFHSTSVGDRATVSYDAMRPHAETLTRRLAGHLAVEAAMVLPSKCGVTAMTTKKLPVLDVISDVEIRSTAATSKISRVVELLHSADGATLEELAAETGWLHHTVRAALTGLRKKGNNISRDKQGINSRYRIVEEA